MARVVKNLPANAEDIRDVGLIPGWEDPLEEGMAAHSVFLLGESHGQRAIVHGIPKSQTCTEKKKKGFFKVYFLCFCKHSSGEGYRC